MFVLPNFNITCGIWSAPWVVPPMTPLRLTSLCNLAWGKRVNVAATGGTGEPGWLVGCMTLLLPPKTDIRGRVGDVSASTLPDLVEVPLGTGRYYQPVLVDDIGRGFANEHRAALLQQLYPWPVPDVS
jgi:hypothetical protein